MRDQSVVTCVIPHQRQRETESEKEMRIDRTAYRDVEETTRSL